MVVKLKSREIEREIFACLSTRLLIRVLFASSLFGSIYLIKESTHFSLGETATTPTTTTTTTTTTRQKEHYEDNKGNVDNFFMKGNDENVATSTTSATASILTSNKRHSKQTQAIIEIQSQPIIEKIPINTESMYTASDILQIVHLPKKFRIEIHLKESNTTTNTNTTRRCQNPYFKGRISGWSLSMIEFENNDNAKKSNNDNSNDIVIGTYDPRSMPVSGRYYVEIIVLLCQEELPRWNNDDDDDDFDLKNVCIIDTFNANNRITAANGEAFIDIDIDIDSHTTTRTRSTTSFSGGRWLHKSLLAAKDHRKHQPSHNNDTVSLSLLPPTSTTTSQPLFTRYQPKGCMKGKTFRSNKNTALCQKDVNSSRFDPYTFHWNGDDYSKLNKPDLLDLFDDRAITTTQEQHQHQHQQHVCFLGSSHSGIFTEKCNSLLELTRRQNSTQQHQLLDLKCSHVSVCYPFQIQKGCPLKTHPKQCKLDYHPPSSSTNTWVYENIVKPDCSHVVIGLFQHPFSFQQMQPQLTFQNWKDDIIDVIRRIIAIQTNSSNSNKLQKIILNSVHTNGLKEITSACPPSDFRTPYNADMCNKILQEIAAAFAVDVEHEMVDVTVSYLNIDFITGPVWDSAEDWSHYNGEEGTEEVKYILSEILKP